MIRINLLGEKIDHTRSHILQVLIFSGTVAATLILCFTLQLVATGEASALREEKSNLESKLFELKKITKRVEDLEKSQKLLKEKLTTISVLKMKKHGPVHILDDLQTSVPERIWLSTIKQKSGALEISGSSFDNQTISQFMGNLEKSPYFGKVDLIHSTQKQQDKVKLKQFLLLAQLKNPLALAQKFGGNSESSSEDNATKPGKKKAKKNDEGEVS